MNKMEKARVVVAVLTGDVYIAELNKTGDEMTDNRRLVPNGEWCKAIVEWLMHFQGKECVITYDGIDIVHLKWLKDPAETLAVTKLQSHEPNT